MKHLLVILALLLPVLARGQGAGSVAVVPTLADLATRVPSQLNPVVQVQGYRAIGDWGAGRPVRYNATSTNAVDNGCVFATVTGVGRWEAPDCDGGRINVRYFGAYGNGTSNDLNYLRAAVAKLVDGSTLYSPPGYTYRITDPVYVTNDRVRVEFSGSVLKLVSGGRVPALRVGPSADVSVSGMNFALDPTTNRVTGVPINTFAAGDMLLLYNLIQNPADYYPGQMAFVVSASGTEMVLDRFPDTALQVTNATRFVAPPDGVEVRNLGVDLSEAGDGIGISAIGRGHLVENCRVTGTGTTNDPNYIGIELRGQSIVARNNYVRGILDYGNAEDKAGYGIFIAGDSISLEHNEIHDCKHTISTSERRAKSTRLRMSNNLCRQRGDWEGLTDSIGDFLFMGNLDVHANVKNVLIQGNYCESWGRWNAAIRNGDFDLIDNYFVIHDRAGLSFNQQQLGFNEAITTRGVIRGNHFITPDDALTFYFGHRGSGYMGTHSNLLVEGNTFDGGVLTFQDYTGTNSNPFDGVVLKGNIISRRSLKTPLVFLGTMKSFLVSGNLIRFGTNGNGITVAADGESTNREPARQLHIAGNFFDRAEGGTGWDVNVISGPTNIVSLGENRWSKSWAGYIGPINGMDSALPVGMYNSRDTYPRIIGTHDGKLKFGSGETYPYSSISLLYPGSIQTDSIWSIRAGSGTDPALGIYVNSFSNFWNFVVRGDGMMAYRYSNEVDSVVATPIVLGPRRFSDLTNGVWRISGNLGITSNAVPIAPESDTATLWLANAAANVRDLRIVWPDGLGGKVDGKLWHEYNDGSGSGLDADLLDGQHGTNYLNRTNITVLNFTDLPSREANLGEIVFVRSGSEVRQFYGTNSIPASGTNRANASASSDPAKWWVSSDINARPQKASWWGMVGDGTTDNTTAFSDLLAFSRDIEISRGRYAFSTPIAITNAESISIVSPDGAYQGGYHSTNLVTETEFVYTGPPTSIFFDFEPTPPGTLRYGNRVENITFNANGLADTSVRIGHMGRARFVGCRFLGATGVNWLVNASQFCTFIDCSTSINDETPTPTVRATYGMSLTNFSPANVFIDCQWENSSGTAVLLAGNAKNNSFLGGAIEANDNDGMVLESGATGNTVTGTWFEANGGTNSLWVKSGAIQNTFSGLRMYEDSGAVRVSGSYNSFRNFGANTIWIEAAGTRNKWENMLWITNLVDETAGGQWFVDMINAPATIRTNTLSSPVVQYGEPFKLWNGTNLHERASIQFGGIYFGDGSNPPDAGWSRLSGASIATSNTVVFLPQGVNDTLLSAYTPGDAEPRVRLSVGQSLAFGPGGVDAPDSILRRLFPATLLADDTAILALRTNVNDLGFGAGMTNDAATRIAMTAGGRLLFGNGAGSQTAFLSYDSIGTMRATTNLIVDGEITLGGVPRSSWPTDADTLDGQDGSYYYPKSGGTNNAITGPVLVGYSTPSFILRDTTGTNAITFTYGGPSGELVLGRSDPSSLTSIGVTYVVFSDSEATYSIDVSAPLILGNTVTSTGNVNATGDVNATGYINAGSDIRLNDGDSTSPGLVMLNSTGFLGTREWFDGEHWNLYTASTNPPYAAVNKLLRVETNGILTVQKPIRTRTGTLGYLTPVMGHAPGSGAAALSTRNSKPVVAYDPTSEEHYRWTWVIPNGFNTPALDGADNLTFRLHWTSSATSGSVRWVVKMQRLTGVDIDSDSFASGSVVTTAASGTAGTVVVSTTGNVGLDSAVAGDAVEIDVYRDTGDAGDTVDSNDAELLAVEIRNW